MDVATDVILYSNENTMGNDIHFVNIVCINIYFQMYRGTFG